MAIRDTGNGKFAADFAIRPHPVRFLNTHRDQNLPEGYQIRGPAPERVCRIESAARRPAPRKYYDDLHSLTRKYK